MKKQYRGIALVGKAGSGKDTFEQILLAENCNTIVTRVAAPLYQMVNNLQTTMGLPIEKDRFLLQTLGEHFKKVCGNEVFINYCLAYCEGTIDAKFVPVVVDVRFPLEARKLKKNGFFIVKVESHRAHANLTVSEKKHVSERKVDSRAMTALVDAVIHNDGTLEEYKDQVLSLVKNLNIENLTFTGKVTLIDNEGVEHAS